MAQNRVEIRTDALEAFGYSAEDPMLDASWTARAINHALADFSMEHDWPWLYAEATIDTIIGQTDYALPAGLTRIHYVAHKDRLLDYRSVIEMIRYMGEPEFTSAPAFYTTTNEATLRVARIPDAVYPLRIGYTTAEPELTTDAQDTLIPEEYDSLLVWYVAKRMALRKQEDINVSHANNEIQTSLRRIRDNIQTSSALPRVRVRTDWPS